ncbi:hypothetical protein QBC39DRAFT_334159 [Podospora conica]|nr:hypothetical protein QBC39DRAFT_334159 [Schizothecium conicum]
MPIIGIAGDNMNNDNQGHLPFPDAQNFHQGFEAPSANPNSGTKDDHASDDRLGEDDIYGSEAGSDESHATSKTQPESHQSSVEDQHMSDGDEAAPPPLLQEPEEAQEAHGGHLHHQPGENSRKRPRKAQPRHDNEDPDDEYVHPRGLFSAPGAQACIHPPSARQTAQQSGEDELANGETASEVQARNDRAARDEEDRQREMLEQNRRDEEQREQERLEKERRDQELRDQERLEQERLEHERLKQEQAKKKKEADIAAIVEALEVLAKEVGVRKAPNPREEGEIEPLLSHEGLLLEGRAEVYEHMRATNPKSTLALATFRENTKRVYEFPQFLSPYFLTLRVFYLWSNNTLVQREAQEAAPPDDDVKVVDLLQRRLSAGENQTAKSGTPSSRASSYEKSAVAAQKKVGSHQGQSKKDARTQIASEMLGEGADSKRVASRAKSLKKQVKCGEYLVKQLTKTAAMHQATSELGLIAVLPWEKMIKRSSGAASLPEISEYCLRWMMERMLESDVKRFILDLASIIKEYILPGMVLDRLARRPPTPRDPGTISAPGDAENHQKRLNQLLEKHKFTPINNWEHVDDPMDAMRHVDGRPLGTVYWDYAGNPTLCRISFRTTDDLIDRVGDVETVITEDEVAKALHAMTGPGCPYSITTGVDVSLYPESQDAR